MIASENNRRMSYLHKETVPVENPLCRLLQGTVAGVCKRISAEFAKNYFVLSNTYMHYLEKAPIERFEAATHEAGHAIACLLVECEIYYWQILGIEKPVRLNRRIRHRSSVEEGGGYLSHGETPYELSMTLAGPASEGVEVFLDPKIHSLESLLEDHYEQSDQHLAWMLAARAHLDHDDSASDREIARRLRLMYAEMFALFSRDPFEAASCKLAKYMMERGAEDEDVNTRMLRFLDLEGFGKDVRAHMKSQFLAIRLPLFDVEVGSTKNDGQSSF